jgi:hypothetical protein
VAPFRVAIVIALLSVANAAVAADQPSVAPVWFWVASDTATKLQLELRLDNVVLKKTSLHVCKSSRKTPCGSLARNMAFLFRPSRAITWVGYRDTADVSNASRQVNGNIWLAGSETNALTIGVSFSTADKILMNTVFIAHPDHCDYVEVTAGMTLTTCPLKRPLTIGSSDRGVASSVSQGGVDDRDKAASFGDNAFPRRPTSSLDDAAMATPDPQDTFVRVGCGAVVGLLLFLARRAPNARSCAVS